MTELKFTLAPEDVQTALRSAIAETLTPDVLEKMTREAVVSLMARPNYSSANELQRIFNEAARSVADDIFRQEFDKPETRAKISDLCAAVLQKFFDSPDDRDKLVDKMADALGRALSGDRY